MEYTAASLVSRVAGDLGPMADEVIADVVRCLRREVPELWSNPDLVRMTSENIAEHVVGVLAGLEHGIEPSEVDLPAAELERARRLARHGAPVTALLRAFRLGQGVVLDRLLAEMPRLTKDAELVGAASRLLIAMANGYVDDASEQGVMAFQEERDRRLQWRLSSVNEAGLRIGTTLDIARTTQELADLALDHFADMVTVDLLDSVIHGHDTPAPGLLVLHRVAQAPSVQGVGPEPTAGLGAVHACPDGSVTAHALATGKPSRHMTPTNPADVVGSHPARSTLVVPLSARGATLGVARLPSPQPGSLRRRGSVPGPRGRGQGGRGHRQRPPLHTRPDHGPHSAAQSAATAYGGAVGCRCRLPLPAGRRPGRCGRRLVRRHPAVRCPGRPGRGRRGRPRHSRPPPPWGACAPRCAPSPTLICLQMSC